MRELKFRAWDKAMQRMLMNVGVHPSMCCINEDYREDEEGAYTISPLFTNYVVMQFTGLRDKNGTEIYEDDIVRNRDHLGQEGIKQVCYHAPCFKLARYGKELRTWHWSSEVIGNIYENPELLP